MGALFRSLARGLGIVALAVVGLEITLQAAHFALFAREEPVVVLPTGGERLRILCIGESTTWGYPDGPESQSAYPSILARRLARELPEVPVDVINEGRNAVTSATILEKLPGWLDRYEPAVVVAMLGQNDHFYHNEAFENALPPDVVVALQSLRTVRLFGLAREQLRRVLSASPDDVEPDPAQYGRIIAIYQQAVADYDAGRLRPAERGFEAMRDAVLEQRSRDRPAGALSGIPSRLLGPYFDAATYLSKVYARTGRLPKAIQMYEGLTRLEPELPIPFMELSNLYEAAGRTEDAERARATGEALLSRYVLRATQRNYRAIHALVNERGGVLVAMQYPLRDVNTLRVLFDDEGGLRFVDNRDSFAEALDREPYPTWFSDRFAGDFGHLTRAGNELLVENLLDQAIRELIARLPR